jgi:hypothetical protein
MHPKYEVLRRQIDALQGRKPDPSWVQTTIQLMLAAGATREDLQEISTHIKQRRIT